MGKNKKGSAYFRAKAVEDKQCAKISTAVKSKQDKRAIHAKKYAHH